jgi:hypothetical protein
MTRVTASVGGTRAFAAILGLAAFPGTSATQEAPAGTPKVNYACLVPTTRTAYRIREKDPKQECSSPEHVLFSWNEGSAPPIQVPIDEAKIEASAGGDVVAAAGVPKTDSAARAPAVDSAAIPAPLPAGSLSGFEVVSSGSVRFKPQLADGADPRAVFVASVACPAGKTVLGGTYEFRDATGAAISRAALAELFMIGTSIARKDDGSEHFSVTIDNPQAVAVTAVMQATCASVKK